VNEQGKKVAETAFGGAIPSHLRTKKNDHPLG
jgi:hypothetical protein